MFMMSWNEGRKKLKEKKKEEKGAKEYEVMKKKKETYAFSFSNECINVPSSLSWVT